MIVKTVKIAHLQLLPLITGVQNVSLQEFRKLGNRYQYTLICAAEGPFVKEARSLGVEIIILDNLVRELSPVKDLKAYLELRSILKREKFDIIHTHSSKTGILGRFAARGYSQAVHTVHGFAFPSTKNKIVKFVFKALEYLAGKFTAKLICLNNDDAHFSKTQLHIPNSVIDVVPNGVDLDEFRPPKPTTNPKTGNTESQATKPLKVVFLGRFWEQKNPELFIRAAINIVKQHGAVASFDLYGEGPQQNELQRLIDDSGYNQIVSIKGWSNTVAKLLQSADILVLPSRWEGLPLALIEGGATGVARIASNIPGNRHCITHDVDGCLFEMDSETGLRESIIRLLKDSELRRAYGDTARINAERHFSIETRMIRLQSIYSSLTAPGLNITQTNSQERGMKINSA